MTVENWSYRERVFKQRRNPVQFSKPSVADAAILDPNTGGVEEEPVGDVRRLCHTLLIAEYWVIHKRILIPREMSFCV